MKLKGTVLLTRTCGEKAVRLIYRQFQIKLPGKASKEFFPDMCRGQSNYVGYPVTIEIKKVN